MATRLYLPYDLLSPISVDVNEAWETSVQGPTLSRRCSVVKHGTPMTVILRGTYALPSPPEPCNIGFYQFISDSLRAQTISGTVKGQIRCKEPVPGREWCRAISIRVASGDGSIIRGTLFDHFPETLVSEWNGSSDQNRYFPPSGASLSEVTAESGDRLVIEVGARVFDVAHDVAYAGHMYFGDDSDTDLPEDETTLSAYNPWIEFSGDISFNTGIKVYQNIGQVLTSEEPKTKVYQNIGQVLASKEPKTKVYQVVGQVLYDFSQSGSGSGLWFCHG